MLIFNRMPPLTRSQAIAGVLRRLPNEVLEEILAELLAELVHDALRSASIRGVTLQSIGTPTSRSKKKERKKFIDGLDAKLLFREILNLCQVSHLYRSTMEGLLMKLYPEKPSLEYLEPIPGLEVTKRRIFFGKEGKFANPHNILSCIFSLQFIAAVCIRLGDVGVNSGLSAAEKLYSELMETELISKQPVSKLYLLHTRLRLTLHRLFVLRSTGELELGHYFQDDFQQVVERWPRMSSWRRGFFHQVIDELSFIHYLVRIGE